MSGPPGSPLPALRGTPLVIISVALAVATFMQVLDTTIANVSVPTIAGDLGVSADQGTWVITAFAVSNGVALPLTGWLMQRFGVVKVFTVSVSLFTFASLLCGLAWNFPSLILFRAVQGIASPADVDLSTGKTRHRPWHLVDHHLGSADLRPDPRRLYFR